MNDAAETAIRWIPKGPGAPLEAVEVQCTSCQLRVRVVVHALELSDADDVREAAENEAQYQFSRVHGRCGGPRSR